jgi:hypothetical protein
LKRGYGIIIFGLIEISIGLVTLAALMLRFISGTSGKPPEVFAFILATSIISCGLGVGVLRLSLHSYHSLLFLASAIILSKILIFSRIIYLNGALEGSIPSDIQNVISVIYHSLLILYFIRPSVKKQFRQKIK